MIDKESSANGTGSTSNQWSVRNELMLKIMINFQHILVIFREADPSRVFAVMYLNSILYSTFLPRKSSEAALHWIELDQLTEDVARLLRQDHNNEQLDISIQIKFDFPIEIMKELQNLIGETFKNRRL